MDKVHLKEARKGPTKAWGDLDKEQHLSATKPTQETPKSKKKSIGHTLLLVLLQQQQQLAQDAPACGHTSGQGYLPNYVKYIGLGLPHPNTSLANQKICPPNTTTQHGSNQPVQTGQNSIPHEGNCSFTTSISCSFTLCACFSSKSGGNTNFV